MQCVSADGGNGCPGMRSPSSSVGRNPIAPAMSRRRRRQGFAREGLLRGKTCGARFDRASLARAAAASSSSSVVLAATLFTAVISRMTLSALTACSAAALVGFFDRSSRRRSRRTLSSAESAANASIFFASVLAFSAASAFPTAVVAFQVGAAKIGLRAFSSCFCSAARASFTA